MSKVYICDDDKLVLMMVERILSKVHEVKKAMTIDELIKLVADDKPDLILLDFQMPGSNGLDGIKRLKEGNYFADVPVIMVTGERDSELEIKCLNEGVEDFVHKPFVPDVLLTRVQMVLDRKASEKDMQSKMAEVIDRSNHDPMTELFNRFYAESVIDEKLANGENGAFAMIDLDNFKYLNDTYGHVIGDEAICEIARLLEASVSGKGFVFRLGGDEFGLFIDSTDRGRVEKVVVDVFGEYNVEAVKKDYLSNSSLSVGIAISPEDGESYAALYAAADKALYCAKRNGKNGYCFYSVDFTDTSDCRAEVVNIEQLQKLIEDRKEIREQTGIYKVDYREFQRIYNYIERCVERTHQKAKLVMVTLSVADETIEGGKEELMKMVDKAIATSLRRNDVGTRYSSSQFLLVLIDVDSISLENVIENRIKDHYEELTGRRGDELVFEIMDIKK
ncbi:MAG: diguanylate cyclase [Lachnospiraceae bacterium]|nr:diguanylate cyclase [Lachnospiraceae bacterium]MBR1651319.1 diguanylate cyclase [Lachnospiraceae bacterium]